MSPVLLLVILNRFQNPFTLLFVFVLFLEQEEQEQEQVKGVGAE
jgi:hypothetical protein